ncbi:hypothetical protein ACOI1H_15150 [Loktanella sp. DJP18]|uniref:hypothetical protein n=1 Tax=Loktanella sp. DJP18 TaxID=3409788 RepID=UPI003BB5E92D
MLLDEQELMDELIRGAKRIVKAAPVAARNFGGEVIDIVMAPRGYVCGHADGSDRGQ